MRSDIERWDMKYRDANPNLTFAPDPILLEHAALLRGGDALDVACGVGHNALHLAARGYRVVAVDGSVTGLRYGQARASADALAVQFVALDLDRFLPPAERFDLVLVVRYLNRALIPALKRSVRRKGIVIYKTFNVNYQKEHPTFNPDYLLGLGETKRLFADFHCLATNDAPVLIDAQTYWIGRR